MPTKKRKIAFLTGVAQGLGKAISLALDSNGATVIAADINGQTLKTLEEDLRTYAPESMTVELDVSKIQDI